MYSEYIFVKKQERLCIWRHRCKVDFVFSLEKLCILQVTFQIKMVNQNYHHINLK